MRLPLPHAVKWRQSVVDGLDGHAYMCRGPMRRRIKAQRVDVTVKGMKQGCAWGQFLDPDHHSGGHWGRFGTSAAVQVLAMDLHWQRDETFRKKVAEIHPLTKLAPNVLIEQLPDRKLEDDLKPDDLDDPMKVAFLVDALSPDACEKTINDDSPGIVDHLLDMAVDRDGWTTRPESDDDRDEKDRLLITAYALWTLRRYPRAQMDERIAGAWGWLANELIEGRKSLGHDMLALGGLALARAHPEMRARLPVEEAISTCQAELEGWALRLREPTLDRAYFNSYSRGSNNDYIFLSPEILAALFFLTVETRRSLRPFVLGVVKAVTENVVPPGLPADQREAQRGFSIQRGMEGTVDQMWALRLLRTFHKQYLNDPGSLRPSRLGWPGIALALFVVTLVVISLAAPEVSEALTVVAAAVFGGAVSVVIGDFRDQRRRVDG